jgi:hypothetical protein
MPLDNEPEHGGLADDLPFQHRDKNIRDVNYQKENRLVHYKLCEISWGILGHDYYIYREFIDQPDL